MQLRTLAAAATLVLGACAAPATERVYVAPTNDNVSIGLEAALDGRGQHVWVQNRSTETIVVTSLRIHDCENIRNRCEVQRMEREVAPGQRVRLATVHPDDPDKRSNFRYGWTWTSSGGGPELPQP